MRLDDLEALLLDPELPSVLILRGKGSGSVPMTDLLRLVRERADPAASEQELDTLMTTLGARRATTIDLSHFRRRLLGLLAGRTWPSGETIYECQATLPEARCSSPLSHSRADRTVKPVEQPWRGQAWNYGLATAWGSTSSHHNWSAMNDQCSIQTLRC